MVKPASNLSKNTYKLLAFSIALIVCLAISYPHITANITANKSAESPAVTAHYVGSAQCADCHRQQYADWQQSDHFNAMQPASVKTVLGNFNNQYFEHYRQSSHFFTSDKNYYVTTDNAQGETQTFQIDYVFGVYPLQQYLISFADGRLQALSIAWDARSSVAGGQRWFDLYDEAIDHSDGLHWTGSFMNWNSRCANCHSTNLNKNYDRQTNSYQTTWSEINVGCEACHGAASQHIDNLESALKTVDMDSCGHCHARRSDLVANITQHPFHNAHQSPMLDTNLYHVDGQIKEEVYVYDSFKQSKMFEAGVQCTDCHNPHSGKVKIVGNGLCLQCHQSQVFDRPEHHHHSTGSPGAQCIECHAPATTYMQVDSRRDHSFRIPRPDWSLASAVPNACTQCHTGQSNQWAVNAISRWGVTLPKRNRIAQTHEQLLLQVEDLSQPIIVRASALQQLANFPTQQSYESAIAHLQSNQIELRIAALRALSLVPVDQRQFLLSPFLLPLMDDPIKAVRVELANLLSAMPVEQIPSASKAVYRQLLDEYKAVLLLNADFPEGLMNLALFYRNQQQIERSIDALKRAILISKAYYPSYIMLADNYRLQGYEQHVKTTLTTAVQLVPDNPQGYYWLGLYWARQNNLANAIEQLQRAWQLQPDSIQYVYTYAIALQQSNNLSGARAILEQGLKRHPSDPLLQRALVKIAN